jgi:2'-5' RNA ligase
MTNGTKVAKGDYRIFVGAFLDGDLAEQIQLVRQTHDPKTARITDPHVTLAGTYWRQGEATSANEADTIERLLAVQAQLTPFELIVGGIRAFPPRNTVTYLHIEPTPDLLAARELLLGVLGPDQHRQFTPHLTLTMRLDSRQSNELLRQLKQTAWHTSRWTVPIFDLWLMLRGPNDPAWCYIQQIKLQGNGK